MQKNKKVGIGITAIIGATVLWGFDGVVLTPRLYNLPVSFVVMVLNILPFLLMHFFLFGQYRNLKTLSKTDMAAILLVALLGGTIGTLSIVKALFLINFKNLSVVVLLQKLQPVFAISLATVFLKERLQKDFFIWAILAIVSGYFLTFQWSLPNFSTGENTAEAALLAVTAAFCFGSTTVLGRKFMIKQSFETITFFRYGFTSIILIVYNLAIGAFFHFSEMTTLNWQIVLVIVFTTGSGAIFLYYFGLQRVRASVSTIAELCFPLSAVFFDYIFNDNRLSTIQWISAAVMLIAIFKLGMRETTKKNPEENVTSG